MKPICAPAAALAVAALLTPAVRAQTSTHDFRYERTIAIAPGQPSSACAVLDEAVYEHARASLDDVRLFSGGQEVPYAITVSNPAYLAPSGEQARVLNLGMRGGRIVFDLAMPSRSYSAVVLDLTGRDFLATATVSGEPSSGAAGTNLGSFTLFDLSGQKLGRSTSIALPESAFPLLHIQLDVRGVNRPLSATPAMVTGARVPPSREAQTLYTEVARSSALKQVGNSTQAVFTVPARVPIERVRFELAPGKDASFSRDVTITAHPMGSPEEEREEVAGKISRIRLYVLGQEIHSEKMIVDATLGANAREAADIVVSVADGGDRPLPLAAVVLEMRQRKLCFPAPAAALAMSYGDAGLNAPQYDFSQTFQPSEPTRVARLGPERRNPAFIPPTHSRSFVNRHPGLIWIVLLGVIAALGSLAFRDDKVKHDDKLHG